MTHRSLPFPSLVAASTNDPLASVVRVEEMARQWRSALIHLGAVGHLNPASGFGPWKQAEELVGQLDTLHLTTGPLWSDER